MESLSGLSNEILRAINGRVTQPFELSLHNGQLWLVCRLRPTTYPADTIKSEM
jgi:hypothetical protein